jgi:hypothetical protein
VARLVGFSAASHNATLGMFKDSPTLLKRALAYLQNPPAKALSFGESEKEPREHVMSSRKLE